MSDIKWRSKRNENFFSVRRKKHFFSIFVSDFFIWKSKICYLHIFPGGRQAGGENSAKAARVKKALWMSSEAIAPISDSPSAWLQSKDKCHNCGWQSSLKYWGIMRPVCPFPINKSCPALGGHVPQPFRCTPPSRRPLAVVLNCSDLSRMSGSILYSSHRCSHTHRNTHTMLKHSQALLKRSHAPKDKHTEMLLHTTGKLSGAWQKCSHT